MDALVQRALNRKRYDLVLACEIGPGIYTSRYVQAMDQIPRVVEDLELSMILAKVKAQGASLERWRSHLAWWKQRRYAARLLKHMDGCTVPSAVEEQLVRSIVPGYGPLSVIPNGVDIERYSGDFGAAEPETLVFAGALTYEANLDAMQFFLTEIFPLVKAARPNVMLRITGRTEGARLDRLPMDHGVVLTGHLEDVRPTVARSAVCVVPIRTGGGTRLKILEAMALRTPVVSTAKGAEGLAVTPGTDILIADSPADFAHAVLRLLGDQALSTRLTENGRRLVTSDYGWDRIGQRLDRFLVGIVEKHQAGVGI
jgi:glycosyltransferase involved in cell wall biosynthesis